MKKAIIHGAKSGAIIGFSLAILNSFLVLISVELSWPIPDPKVIAVFNSDFVTSYLLSFLVTSLFWAIPSALIGSVLAGLFGFMLVKYQFHEKKYIFICTLICALIAGIYLVGWFFVIGARNYMTSHLLITILESPIIGLALVIFPVIFFVLAGRFVSQHLFIHFSTSNNAIPPAP